MSTGSPAGAKRKWRSVPSSDRALSHLQVSLLRALPVGDRRAFSGWFSREGKSGSPRRGCVDKGHWSPGLTALTPASGFLELAEGRWGTRGCGPQRAGEARRGAGPGAELDDGRVDAHGQRTPRSRLHSLDVAWSRLGSARALSR